MSTLTRRGFKWHLLLPMLSLVLIIQAAGYFFLINHFNDWTTRAQVGSAFGLISALFSGLAFASLTYTLIMQQEQISDARNEASRQRADQKQALTNQHRSNHLAALTVLIVHYDERLTQLNSIKGEGPAGAALAKNRKNILERRNELERLVVAMHDEVKTGLGG